MKTYARMVWLELGVAAYSKLFLQHGGCLQGVLDEKRCGGLLSSIYLGIKEGNKCNPSSVFAFFLFFFLNQSL